MFGKKKMLGLAVAAVLVLAVAGPAAAIGRSRLELGVQRSARLAAGTRAPAAVSPVRAAARKSPLGVLRNRILAALERRRIRFDAVDSRLHLRLARVAQIADKVGTAGGDVTAVKASLGSAGEHLTRAEDLEQQAIAAFRAVPQAANRQQAFQAARELGRSAAAQLLQARSDLQNAIVGLRAEVKTLKSAAGGANGH